MSVFDKIKALWQPRRDRVWSAGSGLCLVEVAGLLGNRGGAGPRENLQALQQLARFAQQEKIRMAAVLDCRPLREVGEGDEYSGVSVYFTNREKPPAQRLQELATGPLRREVRLAFTDDAHVAARIASSDCLVMRVATLRKAMEFGEGGGRERENGSGPRRRNRPPRGARPPAPPAASGGEEAPKAAEGNNPADPVRSLIDLVE